MEHRIDSRSGDVQMPGVTDDGNHLLLDADKTHLDVIHLQDLRKERPLEELFIDAGRVNIPEEI